MPIRRYKVVPGETTLRADTTQNEREQNIENNRDIDNDTGIGTKSWILIAIAAAVITIAIIAVAIILPIVLTSEYQNII
jgi:type IV secretory pathway component VirB8